MTMDYFYNGPLNNERANFLSLINFNKTIVSAEGCLLHTDDGEHYLDFTSQYGAVPFGHNPDFLWQALLSQAQRLPGMMIQPFQCRAALDLAQELINLAPGAMRHVTLGCTGAEGVEIAFKMAKVKTGRAKILSTINGFHGKTMAAVLATGNAYYREAFYHDDENFTHIPYNDLEALEAALTSREYAAFIVEPIQGEGGMVVPSPGYLKQCESICAKYGTLYIVDEIQTGLGRTGTLFACEQEDVTPDILIVAKALGGGMIPISACIANDIAWSPEFCKRHSSTFANNQLAAHIGLQVLHKLTADRCVMENVRSNGLYLKAQLQRLVEKYPAVFRSTSGAGFMHGLALAPWDDVDSYLANVASDAHYAVALMAGYLLNRFRIVTAPTLNANSVLRVQPNYHTTRDQIDLLIHALDATAELLSAGNFEPIFRSAMGLKLDNNIVTRPRMLRTYDSTQAGPKLGSFAFFMHPTNIGDVANSLPNGAAAYADTEIPKIHQWIERLKSVDYMASIAYHVPLFPSRKAGYVEGWLISCPLLPADMMRLPKPLKTKLLESYVSAAKAKNVDMIGLGAFTSVISRSGTLLSDCGIPVTTGNSYTALISTDSIRQVCKARYRNLSTQHLAVVGVLGSVGRMALLDIGPDCAMVSLIGNPRAKSNTERLEAVAGELIYEIFCGDVKNRGKSLALTLQTLGINAQFVEGCLKGHHGDAFQALYRQAATQCKSARGAGRFPIMLSNNIVELLPLCDIVITATSNGESFITPELLAPNAIVCDVARPSDITSAVKQARNDVFVYEGGLVNLPNKVRFGGPNIVALPTGVSLACLSETIILTMARQKRNFSLGATASLREARAIFEWGKQHGFSTHLPNAAFRQTELSLAALETAKSAG